MQLNMKPLQRRATLTSRSRGLSTRALLVATLGSCLLIINQVARGFPTGAPDSACKEMKPGHGPEPQSGTVPFQLTQDKQEVEAAGQVKVSLASDTMSTFKGFMVQALNEKEEPVGKFLAGKGLKLISSCSAITHSDREPKKTATLVWEAPASWKSKQAVHFKATVVHKFDQFYMNLKSTLVARRA